MGAVRRLHLVVTWLFVAGVVVQVFLAGLGVFDDPSMFSVHAGWGYTLELLPIILLVLALVGGLGRRQVAYPIGIFVMFMFQSIFVAIRGDLPMVAALHPVNGFGILLVGIAMAREAWLARAGAASAAATAPMAQAAPGLGGR
jgi:Family of unknown function (DUF6220)